jgi:deoxyhypusine synthase
MGTRGHYAGQGRLERRVNALQKKLFGDVAQGKPLTGREDITDVLLHGHPAFGGKHLRVAYGLIRKAIADNYTMFASFAGPITASDYARVWAIPFIKAGYISGFVASDAISYHDAHDAVEGKRKIFDVDMYGDDGLHCDAQIIRITDIGFPEEVLFNTDKFMTWALTQPEFQRKLTTTEYRWQLGKYLHALEQKRRIPHGLLATAYEYDVPGFCASPGDGSVFLNAMKLWAMQNRLGQKIDFKMQLDVAKDVYEACAMHMWGQKKEGNKQLAYCVFGGGASKNYMLQPEPALEQILFVPTAKYQIGVQFTTAPVTDGSLTSCWPSEAISWGKLQKEALTVSVPVDYTMVMSVIAHAILHERARYEDALHGHLYQGDKEKFFKHHPEARGFLREPQRLYAKREQAMELLDGEAMKQAPKMLKTLGFPQ